MKINTKWVCLTAFIIILSFSALSSATDITSCQTISSEGSYILTQDITDAATCLTIQADNVEIDCQGHTIEYDTGGANTRAGIDAIHGTNNRVNLTVKNCNIVKGSSLGSNGFGIRLTRFSNSQIINNTITTSGTANNHGIYLITSSSNNLIENNTINATGSTTGSMGIYVVSDSRNNTIKNNRVTTYGTSTNYALQLSTNADANLVENNNLSLYSGSGTTNGHAVYVTSSYSNNITGNYIYSQGGATNYAVYLVTNAENNLISDNDIIVNGSGATNYGFYATSSDSNTIEYNRITSYGGGNSNYGLRINAGGESIVQYNNITTVGGSTTTNIGISLTTSDLNIIKFNSISTSGTANNYGIQVSQAAQNNITNNTINASGTTTGNNGVYITTNANENRVEYNNISAYGSASNYGVYIYSIASSNTVKNNIVSTNGSTRSGNTFNHGIYVSTTSKYNEVMDNNVSTDGGNANYGINLYTDADSNIIERNNVSARGDGANNHGVYIYSSNYNEIENNTVTTNGTSTDYGVYIHGGSTSNIILENMISTNGGGTSHALYLLYSNPSYPNNNNFSRNELVNVDGNDLNIATAGIDGTSLIDQSIDTYFFTGSGSTLSVINSSYSKISFTDRLTGSGSGFSDAIIARENFVEVDSETKSTFNKTAEITIYGLPTTFTKLAVFRNGEICPAEICTNLTSMQAGNVTFNVTGWTNYSIESTDPLPPSVTIDYPEDYFNSSSVNISFNFTVVDETSSTVNCTLYIDNESVSSEVAANNTLGTIEQTNLSQGSHEWYLYCYDEGGNVNSTANRTFTVDTTPPSISQITYLPSDEVDIDPSTTVYVNATVNESLLSVSTVILEYHNGTDWQNTTMDSLGANIYSAHINLSTAETNYTFKIWANDSVGNSNSSINQTFQSAWDCTWNSTLDLGEAAGFDETLHVGNLTVVNTGDYQHPNSNCTLDFRLTYDLTEGRILYDGESFKNLQLPSGSIEAGENQTVNISARFNNAIAEENAIITLTEFRGRSSTSQRNTTLTLVSTTGGPYLYQKISSAPSTVSLTPGQFSLQGYVRNVVGDDTQNNTAYNVTFNWTIPSGLSVSGGNAIAAYENISNNSLNYNNINISLDSSSLSSLSPGIITITVYSKGYNMTGDPIIHSENREVLTEQANISLECYAESDGIYVTGCGSLDGDYVAPTNTVISTDGSGGGGGGGGITSENVETSSDYQLIRGKENEVKLKFTNKDKEDPLKDLKFEFRSQTIGRYIELYPTKISQLNPTESAEVVLHITSPAYIDLGSHTVKVTLRAKKGLSTYTETKTIKLEIHELSGDDAARLLENSNSLISQFTEAGFSDEELRVLLEESEKAMEEFDYEKVRDNEKIIEKQVTSALGAKKIIEELTPLIELAKEKEIGVSGSERILSLAKLSLQRNEFSKAYERALEAQSAFALETKGEFASWKWYLGEYPTELSGAALFLVLFSFGTYKVSKLQKLKYKIKRLREEEKVINELIKVVQNETFNEKSMGMDEYRESIEQYERKLSDAIEQLIKYETERAHLLRFTGKKKRLNIERDKVLELIKQVQKEYLQDAKIETHSYELKLNSYNKRLSEIDQSIATLEANKALKKVVKMK